MSNINTSLQIEFSICEGTSCSSFDITDTTGVYSASNLLGYGTPNPSIADIDTATLEVEFPDGTSVTIDLLTESSGLFPNTSDVSFTVTNSLLGLSDKITDGVYILTYTITGDTNNGSDVIAWESTCTHYVLFDCQTKCCLDTLFSTITTEECATCNNSILNQVTKAYMYLEAAHKAACCSMKNKAGKLLNNASYLCNKTNCNNC